MNNFSAKIIVLKGASCLMPVRRAPAALDACPLFRFHRRGVQLTRLLRCSLQRRPSSRTAAAVPFAPSWHAFCCCAALRSSASPPHALLRLCSAQTFQQPSHVTPTLLRALPLPLFVSNRPKRSFVFTDHSIVVRSWSGRAIFAVYSCTRLQFAAMRPCRNLQRPSRNTAQLSS
jgi:hypothetical protein